MGNSIKYITPVEDCSYIDIEHEMAMCINNCFTNQNVFNHTLGSNKVETEACFSDELTLVTAKDAIKI